MSAGGRGSAGASVRAGAAYEAILIDKVTGKVDKIIDSLDRLKKEFNSMRGVSIRLSQSTAKVSQGLDRVGKSAKQSTINFQRLATRMAMLQTQVNGFNQAIGQAAIHVGNAMMRMGRRANMALAGVGAAVVSTLTAFSRYEQAVGSLEASWGKSAQSGLEWAKVYSGTVRRSLTQTIEGLVTMRSSLSSLEDAGVQGSTLDELSKTLVGLGVDLAAALPNMTDLEGIAHIRRGFAGEAGDLKRFGFNLIDADVKEYAESLGLAWKNMSQASKMMLKILMLQEQMARMGFVGRAAAEAETLQGTWRGLVGTLENARRVMGEKLAPIAAKVNKMLTRMIDHVAKLNVHAEKLVGVMFGLALVGTSLMALGFILTNFGIALLAVGSIAGSTLAAVATLATLMTGGPIGIAVAAIVSAAAGLSLLFAPFFVKHLPIIDSFNTLKGGLQEIIALLTVAGKLAIDFGSRGEWEEAWKTVQVGGELAFRQLADTITLVLAKAVVTGVMGGFKEIRALWSKQSPLSLLLGTGFVDFGRDLQGALGDQFGDPFKDNRDAIERLKNELDELGRRNTLRDIIKNARPATRFGMAPEGMFSGGERTPGTHVFEDYIFKQGQSLGAFASSFARNVGLFGPALSAQATEKKQDEQKKVMEEQKVILDKINSTIENLPRQVFR